MKGFGLFLILTLGSAYSAGSLQPAKAQTRKLDLAPNEETSGVIAIRGQFPESSVFEITFPNAGEHHVAAVFVR